MTKHVDAVICLDGIEAACADIACAAELLIAVKYAEAKVVAERCRVTYLANQILLHRLEVEKSVSAVVDYVWHFAAGRQLIDPPPLLTNYGARELFMAIDKGFLNLRIAVELLPLASGDPEDTPPSPSVAYLTSRMLLHVESGEKWTVKAFAETFDKAGPAVEESA